MLRCFTKIIFHIPILSVQTVHCLVVVIVVIVVVAVVALLAVRILGVSACTQENLGLVIISWGSCNVGVGVGITILELAVDVVWWWLVDFERTILAGNNVGACRWANRLLNALAVADGKGCLSHISINVGENIHAAVLVDVINTILLSKALPSHIVKPVDHKLEGTVGQSCISSLDVLVVWHELVKNGLLGELIDFSRVGDLSLVPEGCLVLDVGANV